MEIALLQHAIEFPQGYDRATLRKTLLKKAQPDTAHPKNDFIINLRNKMMTKIIQNNKRHTPDLPSEPTTHKRYKQTNKASKKTGKIMNSNSHSRNSNITDFFRFVNPQTTKNQRNETTSNFDKNSGLKLYTINVQQGLMKKIKDILTELTHLNVDLAAITETGLNDTNFKNHLLVTLAAKHGYRVISGPHTDNKASHLLLLVQKTYP